MQALLLVGKRRWQCLNFLELLWHDQNSVGSLASLRSPRVDDYILPVCTASSTFCQSEASFVKDSGSAWKHSVCWGAHSAHIQWYNMTLHSTHSFDTPTSFSRPLPVTNSQFKEAPLPFMAGMSRIGCNKRRCWPPAISEAQCSSVSWLGHGLGQSSEALWNLLRDSEGACWVLSMLSSNRPQLQNIKLLLTSVLCQDYIWKMFTRHWFKKNKTHFSCKHFFTFSLVFFLLVQTSGVKRESFCS